MELGSAAQPQRRFAFVVPRFGAGIAGGAETLIGGLARKLAERGDRVEVWTTCARDHRTWENEFPCGVSHEDGVLCRRFAVSPRNIDVWIKHQIAISQGIKPALEDQLDWLSQGVNSSGLYEQIALNAPFFDALFFGPYLFSTTFFGALIAPEKSVLIPCLHDESYAYLESLSSMFRQVRGAVFNAPAEGRLARELYGEIAGAHAGLGFELWPQSEIEALTPYFKDNFPYLLYLGRKETGKNAQQLIDDFIVFKSSHAHRQDLRLVICGGGDFSDLMRPQALKRCDLIDLTAVSERDKRRLIRHCQVLVQPSRNESFSIVLMEAWLLGRPVLVNGLCPVTREHVLQSAGGLYYSSPAEFSAALDFLLESPELAYNLGQAGLEYVSREYSWQAVLRRFDQAVEEIFS